MIPNKKEYIEKHGEEAWLKHLEKRRIKYSSYHKQWVEDHKEQIREYKKQYYQDNKERYSTSTKEAKTKYKTTHPKETRAQSLIDSYKKNDLNYNRGECTITAKWILENIFNSSCVYCGESDWRKLGCDRIDNSKPHTEDNVVCSCKKCNLKRGTKTFEEFKNAS